MKPLRITEPCGCVLLREPLGNGSVREVWGTECIAHAAETKLIRAEAARGHEITRMQDLERELT